MSSQQSDSARIAAATAEGYSDGLHDGRQEARTEVERLRKAVEHYANESNWINSQEYKTFPGFHGAAVARAALAAKDRNSGASAMTADEWRAWALSLVGVASSERAARKVIEQCVAQAAAKKPFHPLPEDAA